MERKKETEEQRIENFIEDATAQKLMTVASTIEKSTGGNKIVKPPVYQEKELAACAKELFGCRQECVTAALLAAGKAECTVSEARKLVEKFLGRTVG